MGLLITILLLIAFLFLVLAAFNVSPWARVSPGWMGVAILCLVFLIQRGLIG
jgi:hypothetical protein